MKALEDPNLTPAQKQLLNEIQGVRYVVINKQHGGFRLSQEAIERYLEIKGIACWPEANKKFGNLIGPTYWLVSPAHRIGEAEGEVWQSMSQAERQRHNQIYRRQTFSDSDIDRDDPVLVQVVRELGAGASGRFANLKIVEIPADVEWQIEEYDGMEWVAEKHRTWD